ncbi:MAG TPA: hypothetical protein DCZ71_03495 [Ruminococcus sp.]|nr:hypothetical protein [Ruminococcus sp.]
MKKKLAIINAIAGFLLIIAVVLVFSLDFNYTGSRYKGKCDMNSAWHYENGSAADLTDLSFSEGKVSVYAAYSGDTNKGRSLCFVSRNITFNVCLDGEDIYDFDPHLGGYYGKQYGSFTHCVTLPSGSGDHVLTINCKEVTHEKHTGIENIVMQNSGEYITYAVRSESGRFLVCILAFFFGMALFAFGILQQRSQNELVETLSLGVTSMMLSAWSLPPAGFMQFLAGNSAAEQALNHLSLMMLPIPIVTFVASIAEYNKKEHIYAYITACIINIIIQLIGGLTGFSDHINTFFLTHILIAGGTVFIIYMIHRANKRNRLSPVQKKYIVPSAAIVVLSGLIDMIRYYFGDSIDFSAASRFGLLFFIFILAIYEMKQLVAIQVKGSKAELMHKLAIEDSLTGIKNRTGFNEYEAEIMKRKKGKCLFVHFDVNRLKKVNDTYGHAEGDKHIIAAANVLRDSFSDVGECFRVGGDEFFVVLDGKDCHADYKRCIKLCIELQNEYNKSENPPVALQLAYGMAEYKYGNGDPESAERLADTRMYEKKRQMKADEIRKTTEEVLAGLQKKADVREKGNAYCAKITKPV